MRKQTGYVFGAPWSKAKRKAALDRMQRDSLEAQFSDLTIYLNRITDKTGSVLTLAALVFGVSTFVLDKASAALTTSFGENATIDGLAATAFLFSSIGIAILTAAILTLCTNLFTAWRPNWKPTQEDLECIFNLFAVRAIKLQLSLYCIIVAAFLSFVSLACLEYPVWTIAHRAIWQMLDSLGIAALPI